MGAAVAKAAVAKAAAAVTKKPAAIKKVAAGEGIDGAYDERPKGGHASPDSVMMKSGLGLPAYVAPDLTSLAQVTKSIEALLMKAKPRAHALVPSARRAL